MKVFFALVGDERTPGARERIYRYLPMLRAAGVECEVFVAGNVPPGRVARIRHFFGEFLRKVREADVFVNYRIAFPRWQTILLRQAARRMAFDLEDAVFVVPPYQKGPLYEVREKIARTEFFVRRCDLAVAGNTFLAERVQSWGCAARIIPTCIHTEVFAPRPHGPRPQVTIGWSGSPVNFCYLQGIAPALRETKRLFGDRVRILIVSADPPAPGTFDFEFEHRPWKLETDAEDFHDFDIGIMPLDDSDWSKGKCSLKALQCMAVGIPAVVTPVGMNREILTPGEEGFFGGTTEEWVEAFRKLVEDPALRERMGKKARERVLRDYSIDVGFARLRGALEENVVS